MQHDARRAVDLYDAKADAEAVLAAIGAPARTQSDRTVAAWFHPGRAGRLTLGRNALATFGEVHPRVLKAYGIKGAAVAFTLPVAAAPMPKNTAATRPALVLNDLQSVDRDFAFVLDAGVEALAAAKPGKLNKAPFKSAVADFYLTNPIARASAVMGECSRLAKAGFARAAAE